MHQYQCTDTNPPMHQCTNAPMHQCTNAPMHQCANAPMHQCTNAPMLCQAMNTDVDGSTLVVHSRLSLNLAGGTLEQVHITGINSIAPVRVAMQQYQCTSCSAPRVRLFMHWYMCPATHKTPIPMPMPMPPPLNLAAAPRAGALAPAAHADGHGRRLRAGGARRRYQCTDTKNVQLGMHQYNVQLAMHRWQFPSTNAPAPPMHQHQCTNTTGSLGARRAHA